MCDTDTIQLTLDNQGELILPRPLAQQLRLFLGQGPGATMKLPDGQPVPRKGGMQATMDLTEK